MSITAADAAVTTFAYNDSPPVSVTKSQQMNSCGLASNIVTSTKYDGFGRLIQEMITDDDGQIFTGTEYDALGRVFHQSNPYRAAATAINTETQYDDLGRVKTVATLTDGAASKYNYALNATTITDSGGATRKMEADALGQITKVTEANDSTLVTTYEHDARANLTKVTQGMQPPRSFGYDSLGRLISATNPETGTISYSYYDNGNLKNRTHAGVVTSYSYDEINRLTSKSYSGSPVVMPSVTYCYDGTATAACSGAPASANPVGRLTQVVATDSSVTPAQTYSTRYDSYDQLGRVLQSSQLVAGVTNPYTFSYKYDRAGNLETITYPSTRKVTTCYDSAGRAKEVRNGDSSSTAFYASGVKYAEHGAVKQLTMGNSVQETRSFNSRLQPTGIALTNSLLNLTYAYCPGQPGDCSKNNGNVQQHTITGAGVSFYQYFGYDGLNRIKTAGEYAAAQTAPPCPDDPTHTSQWCEAYSYDQWGNRTISSRSGLTSPATEPLGFDSAHRNQMAAGMMGGSFHYDSRGNMDGDPVVTGGTVAATYVYDAENRLAAYCPQGGACMPSSPGATAFVYDGDGRRVVKSSSSAVTKYVYDLHGQLAAEYSTAAPPAAGVQYLTTDALGSVRVVTDVNGNPVERRDYYPFGGQILATTTNGRTCAIPANCPALAGYSADVGIKQLFTGQERDVETGLDFFGARYFSGSQGRFTSPDWSERPQPVPYADLNDPQTLNLYSYGRNNPLNTVDRDGHLGCGFLWLVNCPDPPPPPRPAPPPAPQNPSTPIFPTSTQAGATAARVDQQRQQATGSEHASSIYTLGPAYTYTDPVTQNKPTTVDPNNTTGYYNPRTAPLGEPPIPAGTQLVGEAHSHPDQVGFSGPDMDRAQLLTLPGLRLPRFEASFLGLPDGTVMKYGPRKPVGQRVTVFRKGQP